MKHSNLLACAVILVAVVAAKPAPQKVIVPPSMPSQAPTEAFVRSQLRDPSSAIFSDFVVCEQSETGFLVGGKVNSRNGFGGMTGPEYYLVERAAGGTPHFIELILPRTPDERRAMYAVQGQIQRCKSAFAEHEAKTGQNRQ